MYFYCKPAFIIAVESAMTSECIKYTKHTSIFTLQHKLAFWLLICGLEGQTLHRHSYGSNL